jgi:hypothetical protein
MKVAHIVSGDLKTSIECDCSYLQVMSTHCVSRPTKVHQEPSIDTHSREIERNGRDRNEHAIHKLLSPLSSLRSISLVNANLEFARGNRGNGNRLVGE